MRTVVQVQFVARIRGLNSETRSPYPALSSISTYEERLAPKKQDSVGVLERGLDSLC
jgi:hypothetical protein